MEKSLGKTEKPAWHKDAKWIFGIMFFVSLWALSILGSLYYLTKKDVAIKTLTTFISINYSRKGLDDPSEINEFVAKAKAEGKQIVQPIPNLNVSVALSELEGKSPRGARMVFFDKMARAIYEKIGGFDPSSANSAENKKIMGQYGFVTFLNANVNNLFRNLLVINGIISALLLAGVIYFSRRFGKIFSFSIILLIASFPQAIFWTLLWIVSANNKALDANFIPEGKSMQEVGGYTAQSVLRYIAPDFAKFFLGLLLASILLLILTLILKLIPGKKDL